MSSTIQHHREMAIAFARKADELAAGLPFDHPCQLRAAVAADFAARPMETEARAVTTHADCRALCEWIEERLRYSEDRALGIAIMLLQALQTEQPYEDEGEYRNDLVRRLRNVYPALTERETSDLADDARMALGGGAYSGRTSW